MSDLADRMGAEALRIEEDSLYSGKGHFEAARTWGTLHLWLGIPTASLAAIASASAFKQETIVAGVLALAAAVLSAVSTFLNPSARNQLHHQAGVKHLALRNKVRIFRELDMRSGASEQDLLPMLRALAQERDELNLSNPQIPRFAFARARRGTETGEAAYVIDSAATAEVAHKRGA